VIEHLSTQGKPNQREGSVAFGVQTKLEPLLLVHMLHQNRQKRNKMEKVMALQSRVTKNSKKQTIEHCNS
jgi:hypothetical protein